MAKWLTVAVMPWVYIQCVETNLTGIPHLFGKTIAFAASALGSMTFPTLDYMSCVMALNPMGKVLLLLLLYV